MSSDRKIYNIKTATNKLIPDVWFLIKKFLHDEEFSKITPANKLFYRLWKDDPRFKPNGTASETRLMEMYRYANFLFQVGENDLEIKDTIVNIFPKNAKNFFVSQIKQVAIRNTISRLTYINISNQKYHEQVIPAMVALHLFMNENFNKNTTIEVFDNFINRSNVEYSITMINYLRTHFLEQYYRLRPEILYSAIKKHNTVLVEFLLREFSSFNRSPNDSVYNEALTIATDIEVCTDVYGVYEEPCDEIIRLLVQTGVNVKQCDKAKSTLFGPIRCGFSGTVRLLLDNGADPNNKLKNVSPLQSLFDNRHRMDNDDLLKTTKILIEFGARLDSCKLLEFAIWQRDTTIFTELFLGNFHAKMDPNMNDSDGYPIIILSLAIGSNAKNTMKLLDYRANPSVRGYRGVTPLMYAAEDYSATLLSKLLSKEYKIDVNEKNDEGETALIYAMKRAPRGENNQEVINCLLAAGADVDLLSQQHKIKLFSSVRNDDFLPVISIMLDRKIDINVIDAQGNTALMNAVQNHAFKTANYLLERKAQLHFKSHSDKTVIDYIGSVFEGHGSISQDAYTTLYTLIEAGGQLRPGAARYLLWKFIMQSSLSDLKKLLTYDAIINIINSTDSRGRTLLTTAIDYDRPDAIMPLIESKADPNLVSINEKKNECVPLLHALRNAKAKSPEWRKKVIEPLLNYCADPQLPGLSLFSKSVAQDYYSDQNLDGEKYRLSL